MPIPVSVLLPVYNGFKYLPCAIESVLSQTYPDFELLISDDCSDDQSLEIIEFYAKKDKRIIAWQNEVRKGLFGNYNQCLKRASGNFIKPFAQDDVLHPQMLEQTVQVLENYPHVALVSVARRAIDQFGMECADSALMLSANDVGGSDRMVPAREVIENSLFPVSNFIGEPTTVLFRAGSIGNGFDEAFHHLGDLDYWLRILRDGDFFHLSNTLADVRWHAQSTTRFNLSQLLFVPDIWRLGSKYQSLFETLGHSREDYQSGAMIGLAWHIDDLVSRGELRADDVRFPDSSLSVPAVIEVAAARCPESDLQRERDLGYFREVVFHALLSLARNGDAQRTAVRYKQQERYLQMIRSRERKLQALLSSRSWTATKFLRDINRLIGALSQGQELDQALELTRQLRGAVEEQREYVGSLRQLHRRVTRSRSWALTEPFRALGRQVEPLLRSTSLKDSPAREPKPTDPGTSDDDQAGSTAPASFRTPEIAARTNSQHYLAMAATFRNEAPYLAEWIEFHRLVGVERFYLFNNLSTDDFSAVLQPYINEGIVELIDWPLESRSVRHWNSIQCTAYNMAARLALGNVKWLAFLDVDEFLFPLAERDLKRLLVDYEGYGGLCANWRLFGTSGVRAVGQTSLIIETLTRAASVDHPEHLFVKSIIQPERVAHCTDPHFWVYKPPFSQVTSDGLPFCGSLSPTNQSDKIRINHYRLRDEIGYELTKRSRYTAWNYADGLAEKYHDELNEVEDRAILRFVPELRARMKVSVDQETADATVAKMETVTV